MRLGIFGGTFDPVHYGHLLLAESCREQCRLDQVWFLPAAVPPHKHASGVGSAEHRVEMLKLALAGHPALLVSTLEIDRGGVSYTVETLSALHHEHPQDQLFLLLGADMLADLPTWREPARVCELALPVVVARPPAGDPELGVLAELVSPARLEEIRRHRVQMPQMDLSSREIRRRIAAGLSIRYWTPRSVEKYIETHGLYRPAMAGRGPVGSGPTGSAPA